MSTPESSQPGRPAGQTRDVRAALVDAARRRFAARGFEAVSLREIGEAAGVTPAMVRYYFGGKIGLYEAAVEAAIEPLFARLAAVPGMTDIDELITGITTAYGEVVARDPWLPPLVMREVLLPEGRLRKTFAERFAGRAAPVLVSAFEAARERGEVRDDIEPAVAALGLVALAVFPHLARPVVREVFGLDPAGVDRERVVEQIGRLYSGGVKRPETS